MTLKTFKISKSLWEMKKPFESLTLLGDWVKESWERHEWIGDESINEGIATCPPVRDFFDKNWVTSRRENGMGPIDELIFLALLVGVEQGKRIWEEERPNEESE
jgi:hypothetical protein